MKRNTIYTLLLLLTAWQILSSSMRDPNNPPTGRTGAPGETTCGASGCHTGGNYSGEVTISGVPDTIVAGQTYTITLTHASNAVRAGFELTCLDASNAKCGTLTNISGTSLATAGGRQYIRQSSPKNLSNGSTSWDFTWQAPASPNGSNATFYFASLAANGNGQRTGDNVLTNTKGVVFQAVVATGTPAEKAPVRVYADMAGKVIHIDLSADEKARAFVYDLKGNLMIRENLSQYNELDVSQLAAGLYVVQVETSKTVSVQKVLLPG
ncbi:MAG: choice-of-anchor V domain-containing protein [Saprospiraceae bacterium]|nr:T9SS type A sorting domain-containing protein [Lewinellaceae bacterium]